MPIGESAVCVRAYGIDDTFRDATWFGRPAAEWFAARRIDPQAAGVDLQGDWQSRRCFRCSHPMSSTASGSNGRSPNVLQRIRVLRGGGLKRGGYPHNNSVSRSICSVCRLNGPST